MTLAIFLSSSTNKMCINLATTLGKHYIDGIASGLDSGLDGGAVLLNVVPDDLTALHYKAHAF
jgi:hypothetical protein